MLSNVMVSEAIAELVQERSACASQVALIIRLISDEQHQCIFFRTREVANKGLMKFLCCLFPGRCGHEAWEGLTTNFHYRSSTPICVWFDDRRGPPYAPPDDRRASRKNVNQYQIRAIGTPMS